MGITVSPCSRQGKYRSLHVRLAVLYLRGGVGIRHWPHSPNPCTTANCQICVFSSLGERRHFVSMISSSGLEVCSPCLTRWRATWSQAPSHVDESRGRRFPRGSHLRAEPGRVPSAVRVQLGLSLLLHRYHTCLTPTYSRPTSPARDNGGHPSRWRVCVSIGHYERIVVWCGCIQLLLLLSGLAIALYWHRRRGSRWLAVRPCCSRLQDSLTLKVAIVRAFFRTRTAWRWHWRTAKMTRWFIDCSVLSLPLLSLVTITHICLKPVSNGFNTCAYKLMASIFLLVQVPRYILFHVLEKETVSVKKNY